MRCPDDERISAFLDGEANGESEGMALHLGACERCSDRALALERLGAAIRIAGGSCLSASALARIVSGAGSALEEQHAERCAACRAELRAVHASLAAAGGRELPAFPALRRSRILASVRGRPAARNVVPAASRFGIGAAAAAAALLVLALFLVTRRPPGAETRIVRRPPVPGKAPVPAPLPRPPREPVPAPPIAAEPRPETPAPPVVRTEEPAPSPNPVEGPAPPESPAEPPAPPVVVEAPAPPKVPEPPVAGPEPGRGVEDASPSPGDRQGPLAIALEVRGQVRHGSGVLSKDEPVFPGDTLAFAPGAVAALALSEDGHRIVAGGGAVLRFLRQDGILVRVDSGELVATVPAGGGRRAPVERPERGARRARPLPSPSALWFETPEAQIRILGTELHIVRTASRTVLTVREGLARMENDAGSVDVRARQQAYVSEGDAPSRPVAADDFWEAASFALDWVPGYERLMREDFSGPERARIPPGFAPFRGERLQAAGSGEDGFAHLALDGGFLAGDAAWTSYVASVDLRPAPGVPAALLLLAQSEDAAYEVSLDGERRLSVQKRGEAPEREHAKPREKERRARAADGVSLPVRGEDHAPLPAPAAVVAAGPSDWITVKALASVQPVGTRTRVQIFAKAWVRGTPEPPGWMVQVQDGGAGGGRVFHRRPFAAGRVGVELLDASHGGLDVDNLTVIRLPK